MRSHVLALHTPRLFVVRVGTQHLAARNAAVDRNDGNTRIVRFFNGLDNARPVGGEQDNRPRAAADRLIQLVNLHIAVVLCIEKLDLDTVRLCLCCKGILDLPAETVAVVIVRINDAVGTSACQPAACQPETHGRQEQHSPLLRFMAPPPYKDHISLTGTGPRESAIAPVRAISMMP